jgi:regulator of protease activity HflC (stomatin/prohibitin superfamily)
MDRIDASDRPQAIMTFGRAAAAAELKRRLQKVVESDLGVEIVNVGIQGIHPPQESGSVDDERGKPDSVAKAYEEVMESERRIEEKRYEAQAQANEILTRAAGNPGQALRLTLAIHKQQQLESLRDAKETNVAVQVDERVATTLAWAREELRSIQLDIAHDQLMGKVPPSSGRQATTAAAAVEDEFRERLELRDQYLRYIAELEDIKAGKPGKLAEALAEANGAVEDLFKSSSGQPAALESDAQAQRWAMELDGRAKAENFQRELAAYKGAPNLYMLDRYLDVYDQVMPGLTKYIFAVDRNKIDLRVDLRTEVQPMEGAMEKSAGSANK